jgi:hypothetical protein
LILKLSQTLSFLGYNIGGGTIDEACVLKLLRFALDQVLRLASSPSSRSISAETSIKPARSTTRRCPVE